MEAHPYKITRATIEHLPQLKALWIANELPCWELEKKLTEFIVAETDEGLVKGAIGLEILKNQGRIHSEAYFDQTLADQIRPLFWERILKLARASGLTDLWTQEQSPFWEKAGMRKIPLNQSHNLPHQWRNTYPPWLHYKMLPSDTLTEQLEKQIASLLEMERIQLQKAVRMAKLIRTVTIVLVTLLFLGCLFLFLQFMLSSARIR